MARFPTQDVAAALKAAATTHHVPLSLLMGVAFTESGFDPSVVGKPTTDGQAQGLMQLMPATIRTLGVTNPLDARESAMGGARFLARLARALDWNVPAMLAAYNWGPLNYARAKTAGRPIPTEVARYVRRVLNAQHYYRTRIPRPPGTLIAALNTAITQLAADNPLHVPATQLAGEWSAFYAKHASDSDATALTSAAVKRWWQAYGKVYERAPMDLAAPHPSLVEPDLWLRAAKAVDSAIETAKDVGAKAALGLGGGLFVLLLYVFVVGTSGKRR